MTTAFRRHRLFLSVYFFPQRKSLLLLVFLLFATMGIDLVNPLIVRRFIDTATSGGALPLLLNGALLYIGLTLLNQVLVSLETYAATNVGLTATNRLRADLTGHCLRLDLAFHTAYTPGELIERVDGDASQLGNFFSRFILSILSNVFLMVGVLVMLFRVDWRIGVALTILAALSTLLSQQLQKVAVPYWDEARQKSAALFGFVEERISGREDIAANGSVWFSVLGLREHAQALLRSERRAMVVSTTTWTTLLFFSTLGTVVALGIGVYLYRQQQVTIGTVYLIFSYTALLNRPIGQIMQQVQDLQKATASLNRVDKLLKTPVTILDGLGTKVPTGALAVEFDDVSFGYSVGTPVLENVSFALAPGTVLGLLGRTGSGKTTVAKLLFRLYDTQMGTVRLGGADVRDMHLCDLRDRVALVTQDVQLIHASVRDNLTLFDRMVDDRQVIAVLERLDLTDWYRSLPEGLDTMLASGGRVLSGGEAQLLAFARAFLKNPDLVILDEPSARLDPLTEARLERAVNELLVGRTGIIVAHRLKTLARVDSVAVLEQGRLTEYGSRADLAQNQHSHFAALLAANTPEALA